MSLTHLFWLEIGLSVMFEDRLVASTAMLFAAENRQPAIWSNLTRNHKMVLQTFFVWILFGWFCHNFALEQASLGAAGLGRASCQVRQGGGTFWWVLTPCSCYIKATKRRPTLGVLVAARISGCFLQIWQTSRSICNPFYVTSYQPHNLSLKV